MARFPNLQDTPEVQESKDNIESVFHVLQVRVQEILDRLDNPKKWGVYTKQKLLANFMQVFAAIEKNSKGNYGFVYKLAAQGGQDYYIHMDLQSIGSDEIYMPSVFQDVMRDLIANARKYTLPGGNVLAGLLDDGQCLRFAVEDNGCGIPGDEIESVVDFGYRGSNVEAKRTMGGGFGLTKAYWVTKQFAGRMWISSAVDKGTRVDIHIPYPTSG